MDYRLMHKNVAVMEFTLDDVTCSFIKLGNVFCSEHLPVGIPVEKGRPDRGAFNDWWRGRAIPASRQGIRDEWLILKAAAIQKNE